MAAKIEHLIVLMMENRSFDHLFGYFQVEEPAKKGDQINGLTGAEFNLNVDGSIVRVSDTAKYSGDYRVDPGHHFPDVMTQVFGDFPVADPAAAPTMGGFVKDYASQLAVAEPSDPATLERAGRVMKCFRPTKLPVLTGLAQEFAICDAWFSSLPGPTLPNRAFAHCGTSAGHVGMNPVAYWNVPTLYESLDKAGLRSKVYSFDGNTLAFTFKRLFAGGQKFLGQYSDFLDDLDGKALPSYCFLEPRFNDWYDAATHQYLLATDQHPDNNMVDGERFIAEVYKAIRASKYWEKSLFVIVYDEHGGFYDHVPPPAAIGTTAGPEFDFTRLGVRVPAVLVSPFIKPGTIVHDVFDHTSLIATARRLLAPSMKPLSKREQAAATLDVVFNLAKPRETPKSFKAKRQTDVNPNTHGAGALTEQQRSQVLAASYLEMSWPVAKRVLGKPPFRTLEDINTEQRAAEYIRAVAAVQERG